MQPSRPATAQGVQPPRAGRGGPSTRRPPRGRRSGARLRSPSHSKALPRPTSGAWPVRASGPLLPRAPLPSKTLASTARKSARSCMLTVQRGVRPLPKRLHALSSRPTGCSGRSSRPAEPLAAAQTATIWPPVRRSLTGCPIACSMQACASGRRAMFACQQPAAAHACTCKDSPGECKCSGGNAQRGTTWPLARHSRPSGLRRRARTRGSDRAHSASRPFALLPPAGQALARPQRLEPRFRPLPRPRIPPARGFRIGPSPRLQRAPGATPSAAPAPPCRSRVLGCPARRPVRA